MVDEPAPAAAPVSTETTVENIVNAIAGWINTDTPDDQFESRGRDRLRQTVARYVETGETMELVFPGFPFKSTSRKKVLGALPDYAEEVLLKRLDAAAVAVEQFYPPGVMVRIVSDGVVYQGLLFSVFYGSFN